MLRSDDYVKSQLVTVAWRYNLEYGGFLGAQMIMGAIMNRVRLGWGSHLDVIERIPLFAAEKEIPNKDKFPQIWEPNFTRLLHEVEGQFDNSMPDKSCGAVYWADLRRIETDFFKEKILGDKSKHPMVSSMNTLSFFA